MSNTSSNSITHQCSVEIPIRASFSLRKNSVTLISSSLSCWVSLLRRKSTKHEHDFLCVTMSTLLLVTLKENNNRLLS